MGRIFKHLDVIDAVPTVPGKTGSHAVVLVSQLYSEASKRGPDHRADEVSFIGRTIGELEEIVIAMNFASASLATEWARPTMSKLFRAEMAAADAMERLSAFIEEDTGINLGIAAIAVSPAAPDFLYGVIQDSPDFPPPALRDVSAAEVIAAYGLYFMDCYLEEVSLGAEGSYEHREIHLQQSGICLHIAGIFRMGRDLDDQHDEENIDQKKRAAKARDKLRYEPLRKFAIQAFVGSPNWKSTRAAAVEIYPAVLGYAKERGLYLSPDRAQTTVYEWLLAHARSVSA